MKRVLKFVRNMVGALALLILPILLPCWIYAWLFPFWWKTAGHQVTLFAVSFPGAIIFWLMFKAAEKYGPRD